MRTDILISEVGPRDGLQSISAVMPTEAKKAWIAAEAAAGVREIEVGSFVPATLLPQLADTAEIVDFAKTIPGLTVAVLVPNLRGAEAAIEAGADKITLPLSVSESHSMANLRRSHGQCGLANPGRAHQAGRERAVAGVNHQPAGEQLLEDLVLADPTLIGGVGRAEVERHAPHVDGLGPDRGCHGSPEMGVRPGKGAPRRSPGPLAGISFTVQDGTILDEGATADAVLA